MSWQNCNGGELEPVVEFPRRETHEDRMRRFSGFLDAGHTAEEAYMLAELEKDEPAKGVENAEMKAAPRAKESIDDEMDTSAQRQSTPRMST